MALLIYLNDLFMLPFIPQWCYCYQEDYKLLFPIENKSHLKTQKEMKQKKKKKRNETKYLPSVLCRILL